MLFLFCLKHFESACRTCVFALLACEAALDLFGVVELRLDDRVESSADETKQTFLCILVADPYAQSAEYSLALVPLDDREFLLDEIGMLVTGDTLGMYVIHVRVLDELAVRVVVASALQTSLGFLSCSADAEAEVDLLEIVPAL